MNGFRDSVIAIALFGMSITGAAGGQEKEGPDEIGGREIDRAAGKTGRQNEKAGDKIQHAFKNDK